MVLCGIIVLMDLEFTHTRVIKGRRQPVGDDARVSGNSPLEQFHGFSRAIG